MTQLSPGDVVADRFRVDAWLGAGGMGVVYRATQLRIGRPVALKVLRASLEPRARLRFEREARVASALAHPSAVAIHDYGEADGHVYLAMELLGGAPLRARLSPGEPSPLSLVLDVGWQIADVLASAHRMGLVHRDLKPENVFLEPGEHGDRVRVVDFGLAFIAGDEVAGRVTVEGVVTGTPSYASPEQARGREVGPPTDVYSLGCLLFEMLCGQLPFDGTDMEVLTRQMYSPPPALRDVRSDLRVPTALDALVMSMLCKRVEDRPGAEEVRSVLAQLDPDRARSRERARDDTHLLGRAARMVTPPAAELEPAPPPPTDHEVAVVGEVGPELLLALAANAIAAYVVSDEQPVDDAVAVFAPGASVERVASLAAAGAPVVTDTDAADMARISALLRAGASEVVVRPVGGDELARRLLRAIRKRGRG